MNPPPDKLPPPAAGLDTAVFAPDFAGARARFVAAAQRAGADLHTIAHPLPGPDGELLATDLAWVGPYDAERVLVTQSALHGVEGFAGSAAQTDFLGWLPVGALPADTAILHIHAINPWGFAWLRRTNEDGVDLNRNFVDFTAPLPENPGYDALATALLPPSVDPVVIAQADDLLAAWRQAHGRDAFERAVTGGQYRHPQGLFHGGSAPAWSQQVLRELLVREALAMRTRVACVDIHTGLGPYGYGEVICDHPPGSVGVSMARAFYGDSVTEPALGTSTSVPKHGLVDYLWHAELGDRGCFVTLEFGTCPLEQMFPVLRADHMLHAAGPVDWQAPYTQRVKRALRAHFYPARTDWQQLVLFRARQVLLQALRGIAA